MSAETRRVAGLKGYGLLDTPNEPEFDAIVHQAAAALDTPVALISLIDENRQWFKAKVGLDASETPRSISFCTHAIRGGDVFVVPDAKSDPRFSDNPLVTGDPNIRFYAGAPLTTSTGQRIGTLCVIDTRARDDFNDDDGRFLQNLAAETVRAFKRRRERRATKG